MSGRDGHRKAKSKASTRRRRGTRERSGGTGTGPRPYGERPQVSRRPPTPDGLDSRITPFEAEILPGLAPFVRAELASHAAAVLATPGPGEERADTLTFGWRGSWRPLERLRTVTSVSRVVDFDVPRPKALLGDAHFRVMVGEIETVLRNAGEVRGSDPPMRGFRLEAAGSDSPVMRRLRSALAERLGMSDDPDAGELRLRLRPDPGGANSGGWRLTIRLTPRPLSARDWRACNRPGGLNACVAAAAWAWLGTEPRQRVLNAMCGSGTLLFERAAAGTAARLVGIDHDPEALACATANRAAAVAAATSTAATARHAAAPAGIELVRADATRTGLSDASFDVIVADPPWGDAIGDADAVAALHPLFLRESARLLVPGGRLMVVTHALRAFESAVRRSGDAWLDEGSIRVYHGGHRPALRLLRRRHEGEPR